MGDIETYKSEVREMLLPDEELEAIYGLDIDYTAVTSRRLIFVDKTVLSKQQSIISIPFSKINTVALGKGKFLSFTNEIEIHTQSQKFELKLMKGEKVQEFYNKIVSKIT